MNGWMDAGWMDGGMDGWIHGYMDTYLHTYIDGWVDGWLHIFYEQLQTCSNIIKRCLNICLSKMQCRQRTASFRHSS